MTFDLTCNPWPSIDMESVLHTALRCGPPSDETSSEALLSLGVKVLLLSYREQQEETKVCLKQIFNMGFLCNKVTELIMFAICMLLSCGMKQILTSQHAEIYALLTLSDQ